MKLLPQTKCKYPSGTLPDVYIVLTILLVFSSLCFCYGQEDINIKDYAFPICTQFSKIPPGNGGWTNQELPLSDSVMQKTVRNIISHGFNILSVGSFSKNTIQGEQEKKMLEYAQSLGMEINCTTSGFELFNRDDPPEISVYSPEYIQAVRERVQSSLALTKNIKEFHSIFPFHDEPFHSSPEIFDYSEDAKSEFYSRYGYQMPSVDLARKDPEKWLDLLNFQSETFRDGWIQVYKAVKEFDPRPKIIMTHDSHSTFGAGVNSNSQVAIDDAFHWGGDFADMFVYDIYPYMMFDFRYGEHGKIRQPRLSQMHYTIAQMRNLTTEYSKDLGFWVGTYNKSWFSRFMNEQKEQQYWAEREMAYSAIANGANFIITGLNIPEDKDHWEDFGKAMNSIQKAGPGLLKAPKVKAKACFLFPRTQYLQLQEEYYNVGLSFELFLRAFGELDIIHEDQLRKGELSDYKILILSDVKLLPADIASEIAGYVDNGGIVISDCVPQMGAYKEPLNTMNELFGVSQAETGRVMQLGHWVPFTIKPPKMSFLPAGDQKVPEINRDSVSGKAFGQKYQFGIVSPRACEVTEGKVALQMESGLPGLISHQTGKGRSYLFGFCLQDTYFNTWKDKDTRSRDNLMKLVNNVLQDTGIQPHIRSSNPGIEAAIRANKKEGYLFVINHEEKDPQARIKLNDLKFIPRQITDVETGRSVNFKHRKGEIQLKINAPFGTTRLLKVN